MSLVFTIDQVRKIREGRITAALVMPSDPAKPMALRSVRRRFDRHDGDGARVETVVQRVEDLVVTLIIVREVDPLATERDRIDGGRRLSHADANRCGFKSVAGLRASWAAAHPRTPIARYVAFRIGDLRDRPRYLTDQSAGRVPMNDYTTDPSEACVGEAEPLSAAELDHYAAANGQRWTRQRADLQTRVARRKPSHRLALLERAAAEVGIDIRSEMRIVEQRLDRAERRAKLQTV